VDEAGELVGMWEVEGMMAVTVAQAVWVVAARVVLLEGATVTGSKAGASKVGAWTEGIVEGAVEAEFLEVVMVEGKAGGGMEVVVREMGVTEEKGKVVVVMVVDGTVAGERWAAQKEVV